MGLTRRLGLVVVLVAALMVTPGALLPSATAQELISVEQLKALQQLSPEERRALLQAIEAQEAREGQAQDQTPGPARPPAGAVMPPSAPATPVPPAELRVSGGDTLVLEGRLRDGLDPAVQDQFNRDPYRSRLAGRRTFQLDPNGVLVLPGVATVPLAGLTSAEVSLRLAAEPLLAPLQIKATILPVAPTGAEALTPFGYSLFESRPDLFQVTPPAGAPVPQDYVVGPGDSLRVQLYGSENYEVELAVSPEGTISFPRIGPQAVSGRSFGEVKASIEQRIAEQMIGTQAAVSMGRLKTIRIFVVGDVKRPGAYDVSSLSRVSNALFLSGGITEVGSLRKVQLKRAGATVTTLDLYALLLRGDTRNDAQLRDGDVILVPPAGAMVGIDGEVRRPAIYELAGEQTVAQLIELAGGLQPTADRQRLQLERISGNGARSIETLDLARPGTPSTLVRAGDTVRVFPVLAEIEGAVLVEGHVSRPGRYEWFPAMRIVDLLPSEQSLKPRADLSYVLVRREQGTDRQALVLSADLGAALAARESDANLPLRPGDRVTVFELGVARSAAVQAVLEELEAQATRDQPMQAVRITGEVRAPGAYPLEQAMRVSDLLRAGGGLNPSAYADEAELTRYVVGPTGERTAELLTVDITAIRSGDAAADIVLQPYDVLTVKEVTAWQESVTVEVRGEVRFPGTYPIRRGETLASVIERAGGLTDLAFPEGSIFTREFLREREARQLEQLRARLESDLAALAIQQAGAPDSQATEAYGVGRGLLEQLKGTQAAGRLVIDLPRIINNPGDLRHDIELRDGDSLLIPPRSQEVTVIGEVQFATSHRHDPGLKRDEYIQLSGGPTIRADTKRIYVVRANGAVEAEPRSRWFRGGVEVRPGDTVVVPLATDRLPRLTQWSAVTQIIYNLAIAVAAVNSF